MISTFSFTEVSYYSQKEELSEKIWRNNARVYTFQCESMIGTNSTSNLINDGSTCIFDGFRHLEAPYSPKWQGNMKNLVQLEFPWLHPLPKLWDESPAFLRSESTNLLNAEAKLGNLFVAGVVRGWHVQRCGCGNLEILNSIGAKGSMRKCGFIQHRCIFDE